MINTRFNRAILTYAPLIIPASALCGGASGALSGGSFAILTEPGLILFLIAFALVGGLPIGLLFWAMKDTSGSMRNAIMVVLLFVYMLAFIALYIPLNGLANV